VGKVSPPTTGASHADGIQVCGNFMTIWRVTIQNFGRHAVNLDNNDPACSPNDQTSDDTLVEASGIIGNQGDGIYCRGGNCNAGVFRANFLYYNSLWALEDQGSSGSTIESQASYNGSGYPLGYAEGCTATGITQCPNAVIRRISRAGGVATVTLESALPATTLKAGQAVVISDVGDVSFDTPTGFTLNTAAGNFPKINSAFFVTQVISQTEFQYMEPGAPLDASSKGGIARIATFAEAYLGSGLDSGSYKVGTQEFLQSFVTINNYAEGGQFCKYGSSGVAIIGANNPSCSPSSDWVPYLIGESGATNLSRSQNQKNLGYNMLFQAGKASDYNLYWSVVDHTGNNAAWTWIYLPSPSEHGVSGTTSALELYRGCYGCQRRLYMGGPSASGAGETVINSEGTAPIRLNSDQKTTAGTAGTGGLEIWSGGMNSTMVAKIDGSGGIQATDLRVANSDVVG
jgi:hypothetical protein